MENNENNKKIAALEKVLDDLGLDFVEPEVTTDVVAEPDDLDFIKIERQPDEFRFFSSPVGEIRWNLTQKIVNVNNDFELTEEQIMLLVPGRITPLEMSIMKTMHGRPVDYTPELVIHSPKPGRAHA